MTASLVEHRYQPRGAAKAVMESRAGEVLLSGPAGSGKTLAVLTKLLLQALKYPGMRGLILRKTGVSLGSTTLVTWRARVANEALDAGLVWFYGGSREEAAQYRFQNGSSITVGGLDNPDKIMSSEYDVIVIGEATEVTLTDWEKATSRLRNGVMPYQQLLADCNPNAPHHWLNRRCEAGQTLMLHSRHADNPLYVNADGTFTEAGEAYILGVLAKLTGVRRQRLYLGNWAAAEGLIYEGFDAAVHLVDQFEIPAGWERFWSVDFGFSHPFVLQCWAVDPDGRAYLHREIYRTQRLVEDHAADIIAACTVEDPDYVHPEGEPRLCWQGRIWTEPRPSRIICDHDAEGRATLEKHLGMSTKAALKTVTEGIQAVQSRLKVLDDGKPRLYLCRDAVLHRDQAQVDAGKPASTVEEMGGYIWADKGKEQPVKKDDDGMDAGRYFVVDQDMGANFNMRWL
jgi:phage terminase large subunit